MGADKSLYRSINWNIVAFVVPGLFFFLLFRYVPIYFVQIAFRDFRITRSIDRAPWVGLKYFQQLFAMPGFTRVVANTLIISFYKLALIWPLPIILALLLNEIRSSAFKTITQTIIYLPHFISWVVIGGIIINFLSLEGGLVNKLLAPVLDKPQFFLGRKELFRPILVGSEAWKTVGWASIIYLASLSKINPELYEAAHMDGAGRLRCIWHITIPGIADVIVIMLILRIGNILNEGFEQNMVLVNPFVREVGEILDTYVWRTGLKEGRYSYAAAAGLFKTIVAAILLNLADQVAKRFNQQGLF
jgi:putative aldouronate transport system permease protein